MWRDERQAPAQRRVDPTKRFEQIRWMRALFGITSVLDYDDDAMLPRRKPQSRRTRWTAAEYAEKDKYYAGYWGKLHSFMFVAKEGMEGWGDEDELDPIDSDQAEFMVATLFRNHALKGELYRLPKKVLQQRWKRAASARARLFLTSSIRGWVNSTSTAAGCQIMMSVLVARLL